MQRFRISRQRLSLYPAIDGRVVHGKSSFSHHLFQVSIAEGVSQVPPHAEWDDLALGMATLEGIV